MCRRNGSFAPRKRDERPLNIVSRRGMTGWCKQSVERLPSRQTQSTVLRWKRYPTRRRWSMRARIPSTSVRSLRAKCTEAVRSARELRSIDSVGAVFPGKRERAWLWRPEARSPSDCPLFEHRRLSILLLDALVVRGAHNSQLVIYPSQKLGLGFC
ncbi:hypothetical protein DFH11DRAFT_1641155 [Phellopilus nigrolimitatus]|nr:hypothetical protein DFH11DRAFT_1641155 [Phellopilus nigrolimitatus]